MPSSPQVSPSTGNAVRFPNTPELLKQVPAAAGKPPRVFHGEGEGSTTGASHGSPVEPPGPGWGTSPGCSGTLGNAGPSTEGLQPPVGSVPVGSRAPGFPSSERTTVKFNPAKGSEGSQGCSESLRDAEKRVAFSQKTSPHLPWTLGYSAAFEGPFGLPPCRSRTRPRGRGCLGVP